MRDAYKMLFERPGERRPLGRPRSRWEDNNKWIHLAQDKYQWRAVVHTVTNFGFHKRRGIS
jgi:hypothetical protein